VRLGIVGAFQTDFTVHRSVTTKGAGLINRYLSPGCNGFLEELLGLEVNGGVHVFLFSLLVFPTTKTLYHGFIFCQLADKVALSDNIGSAVLPAAVDYNTVREGQSNVPGLLFPFLSIPTEAVRNEKLDTLSNSEILKYHNRESLPRFYILSSRWFDPFTEFHHESFTVLIIEIIAVTSGSLAEV